jgi:hypothetical protein
MLNSSSKSYRENGNLYASANITQNIKYGVVKALENEGGSLVNKGLGRIKVFLKGSIVTGGDDGTPDEDLPWCFPLLPKHLSVQPKIGEVVLVMVFNNNRQHADRLYIGPIISQLPLLNKDPYEFSALAGFTFGPAEPNVNPSQITELNGVFPNPSDVSIQGRYNTDITQKNNEVIIRAGKFETVTPTPNNPYQIRFNSATQGYIQIKNDVITVQSSDKTQQKKGTITNIVSNKINLLTHIDGSPRFNLTNQDNLISDEEQDLINQTAHQLPFGDVLLEYLILLKDALFLHVHNGNGNPATDLTVSGNKQALAAFKSKANQLEQSMLSKNIRIN